MSVIVVSLRNGLDSILSPMDAVLKIWGFGYKNIILELCQYL